MFIRFKIRKDLTLIKIQTVAPLKLLAYKLDLLIHLLVALVVKLPARLASVKCKASMQTSCIRR